MKLNQTEIFIKQQKYNKYKDKYGKLKIRVKEKLLIIYSFQVELQRHFSK
jgi:hypothetical protein